MSPSDPRPQGGAGAPGRAPLTRERVLEAAAELADESGLAALSMRRLGQRLGVEAMSLYHHVRDKQDVLDGLVERVLAEVPPTAAGPDWRAAVRRRCVGLRGALGRHPWAVGLLDSRRAPGPRTLESLEALLGCLRRAGFDVPATAHAVALLDGYVYGFAVQSAALPVDGPEDWPELARTILGALPPGAYPYLRELTTEHVLRPGYDFEAEFEHGLDLVLDALERLRGA